ncbi:MAG: ABC transporter substrate-binding protein [Chloroflexi bacterium]|nr:ABC transporter substrate-binding protein [Chloroflexota bacterium]
MFSDHKLSIGVLAAASLVLAAACGQDATSTPTLGPTPAPTSTFTPVPETTLTPVIATPTSPPTPTEVPFSLSDLPREATLMLSDVNPTTLDPALTMDSRSHRYVAHIFSGLVKLDADLRVVPDLAESWEILDGGTRYVFHLREGATFHSGKAVTAQDIKDSLERATDPETGSETAQIYLGDILGVTRKLTGRAQEISGVRVLNEQTVEILTDAPKPYVLAKLTYPVAAVVDMDNVAAGEEWFRSPNGTGPFKLKAWEDEQFLVLERNQDYYLGAPGVEFVAFRFLAGVPIRLYETDEIDAAAVGISSLQRVLDPQEPLSQELHIFQELTIFFTGFNVSKPPFDDPLVRRAFALALDRERLVRVVLEDTVQRANGFLPPGMPGYIADFPGIPYDPEEARQLLASSDYGGPEELPPIVYTTSGQGSADAVMEATVDMWRTNLGVEVTVRQIESGSYFDRIADEVDNLFDYGWIADYPDPENVLDILFHSQGANNTGRYANDLVDTLLEEARVERVVQRRLDTYRRVQQLLFTDAAAIPLWYDRNYVLVKPYVKGYALNPQGIPTLADVRLER